MKKKYILIGLLFLPVVCLALWIGFLSFQRNTFGEVKVVITGYDPRDLLSGRYIAYQIDWDKTDCTQFENHICPQKEFCKEAKWGRQCRFYVPEMDALWLDRLFATRFENEKTFEVIYAYQKGSKPIAKNLLIDGKPWRQWRDFSETETKKDPD